MIGVSGVIAALLAMNGTAVAVSTEAQVAQPPTVEAVTTVAAAQEPTDPFASAAVSEDDLSKVAGREDIGKQIAQATQRNTVSNNSVVGNSVTGNVVIDGNAFQNLQGLAVISANSGNNVAINSAMNVTINLRPMP